jgi:Uma2 family endonuclease
MSALTQQPDFQIPRLPVRRFTIAEYHQMIDTGILGEDDKVELLDGWIVPKMTRKPPHDALLGIIDDAIRDLLPKTWKVRVQSAITTADSEPEPDLAVVRGPMSRYFSCYPHPSDVGLVVEVADSSLEKDRQEKGLIYAAAGIACYWIVNIAEQMVEVYSDPAPTEFRLRMDFSTGQALPLSLDGQELGTILVRDLFAGLSS